MRASPVYRLRTSTTRATRTTTGPTSLAADDCTRVLYMSVWTNTKTNFPRAFRVRSVKFVQTRPAAVHVPRPPGARARDTGGPALSTGTSSPSRTDTHSETEPEPGLTTPTANRDKDHHRLVTDVSDERCKR